MQRIGSGFHTTTSGTWDTSTDCMISIKWPKSRLKGEPDGLCGILTVYALSA